MKVFAQTCASRGHTPWTLDHLLSPIQYGDTRMNFCHAQWCVTMGKFGTAPEMKFQMLKEMMVRKSILGMAKLHVDPPRDRFQSLMANH